MVMRELRFEYFFTPKRLSKAQIARLRKEWSELHRGRPRKVKGRDHEDHKT